MIVRSVTSGGGRIGIVVRDKAFEVDISQATETYVDYAKDLRGHPVRVGSHWHGWGRDRIAIADGAVPVWMPVFLESLL